MAISNSGPFPAVRRPPGRPTVPRVALWPALGLLCLGLLTSLTRAEPPLPKDFREFEKRFQDSFEKSRARWQAESNSADAAWRFGRAAFDWAEFAAGDKERAAIAEQGIDACRRAVALEPKLAATHYYLGLNLGQLARTKLLGALKLINEMESEWSTAIRLDPKFDFAGPHRSLGVLYRDAPGWPTSVGSEKKSRQHLQKAVELQPTYPGNHITLFEGYVEWGDKKTVRAQASQVEQHLKTGRVLFSGEAWAWDWLDWDRRWAEVKRKAGVVTSTPP